MTTIWVTSVDPSSQAWQHEHTESRHGPIGEILSATPVAEVDPTVPCTASRSGHSETGAHHRGEPPVDPGVERDHTHQAQISWTQKQGVLQGVPQGEC